MHVDERIARLAARQHGMVTIGQLKRFGLRRGAIEHRRRRGLLLAVHRGVYAFGHDVLTDEGRLLAAVMACGGTAVLSHEHATHLWGMLPRWHEIGLVRVHVTVPPQCNRGRRPGIAIHRSMLRGDEVTRRAGIPVTTPARTLIDYATTAEIRSLERAVDQAVTDGLVTTSGLRRAARRHGARPGGAAVRRLLGTTERFDSLSRSELEEAFLAVVREAGLPEPSLNAVIEGMRVDAVWRRERVAVELDGYRWHRTRGRFEADRERDLRLRRGGWVALRYSARQVFDKPVGVIADLVEALARARAEPTDLDLD